MPQIGKSVIGFVTISCWSAFKGRTNTTFLKNSRKMNLYSIFLKFLHIFCVFFDLRNILSGNVIRQNFHISFTFNEYAWLQLELDGLKVHGFATIFYHAIHLQF